MIKPLSVVYRSFVNPPSSSFAWVGDLIFLNDFHWSPQLIHGITSRRWASSSPSCLDPLCLRHTSDERHTDIFSKFVWVTVYQIWCHMWNWNRDDESTRKTFEIPPQNFRETTKVHFTIWQMFCTFFFTIVTNVQKKYPH